MNSFILTLSLFLLPQTEIAKRLNAILAQIMPFLSQEVSFEAPGCSSSGMKMTRKLNEQKTNCDSSAEVDQTTEKRKILL